jgi:hypothetical protein
LAGCPFSTEPEKKDGNGNIESKFKPRTSPENLLYNLRMAYDERDLSEYDSLLASDFTFFLSPDDIHIAERFNRFEEIEAHQNLFDADLVQQLRLTFDDVTSADVSLDPAKTSVQDSLWTTTLTNVDLYLFGKTPNEHPDEPPGAYQMDDGQEQFWFRRNSWKNPQTGDYIWTIVEWQELGTGK